MSIRDRLSLIQQQIAQYAPDRPVTLVAVSKYAAVEQMQEAYAAGVRHFGENRVQDALAKMEHFPAERFPDLQWHLIGPLQSNKAKKTVGRFCKLHAIDSIATAEALSRHNTDAGTCQSILLQVNMSEDPTRHGFSPEALSPALDTLMSLEGIAVQGLMTMAPPQASLDQDLQQLSSVFCGVRTIRDELVAEYGIAMPDLSMGMSHDFPQALECGATIIRLGNYLFKT